MNLVLSTNQFNKRHLYFDEPIQNTIIENSKFIKITYSTELFSMAGVFFILPIKYIKYDTHYNKLKFTYDITSNNKLLNEIFDIEDAILNKNICLKTPKRIIRETLSSGSIKIYSNSDVKFNNYKSFILKISGIWESDTEYGVTYKMLYL